MEPSANIARLAKPEFPQKEEINHAAQKTLDPKKLIPTSSEEQSDIAVELASPESQKKVEENSEPKTAAEAKMRKLKEFNGVAEKFSKFEAAMAALGTIFTGANSDWLAYFHESVGEYASNHLGAAEEGEKEINGFVKAIFKVVGFIWGVKNKEGNKLESTTDFVKAQDRLVGALNMTTSIASFAVIGLKSLPAAIRGEESEGIKIPGLHFAATKVMPLINAVLMWMSGAAKRRLAFDLQKEVYNEDNKAEIDGAFTTGAEDYICGANSAGLMVRQAIGTFSPKLASILEPVFATWIAGSAMKAGYEGYKEVEEDEPKFELSNLDKSAFGNTFYNIAKSISKPMGVELPELSSLAA